MKKDEVLERLQELGFDVEEVPDFGYIFKYERQPLLYMPDNDENYLRFAAPNIFDVTEDNRAFVLEVVNDTNMSIKYGKVCICGEQVWVFCEHRLFGEFDIEEIIEHSLFLLRATIAIFHRKVEGEDFEDIDEDNE